MVATVLADLDHGLLHSVFLMYPGVSCLPRLVGHVTVQFVLCCLKLSTIFMFQVNPL